MIPVAVPYIAPNSAKYVQSAIAAGAISGLFGEYLPEFERRFAEFIGVEHAVACSNGTVAIHLPLAALGIGPGDEVLVSALTNMATFFAVIYCGATPVPVDIDPQTYGMSVEDCARKITKNTKAVIAVHLFGQSVEMVELMALADGANLPVLEDCAESHGATLNGQQSGSWGLAGCFSFFANKNVSTGEGGMVTTNDAALAGKMRSMRSLSFGKVEKFLHEGIGFNYRMDNLKAALGCAQMDEIDYLIASKVHMGETYDRLLADQNLLILPVRRPHVKNVYWMYHSRLVDRLVSHRRAIMDAMTARGVETRPGFVSYTLQPFADPEVVRRNPCPVAEKVSYATWYIPSSHDIDEPTQAKVVKAVLDVLSSY